MKNNHGKIANGATIDSTVRKANGLTGPSLVHVIAFAVEQRERTILDPSSAGR